MQEKFESMLGEGQDLDVITFAGNGEPTLHPKFAQIINDTIELRDKYFPKARIAVLSNSTMLHKKDVVEALNKIEQNILKLDSGIDETIQVLNKPQVPITVEKVISNLEQFNGNFILQTMFVKGSYKGKPLDNTTPHEVEQWISIVKRLMPKEIMVYTIARDTPVDTLEKVSVEVLEQIAQKARDMGIPVQVSG
jgi:wyosine [tRNA(Phe)-imidazoG37] synthetase (radical SAM superfamily)